MEAAMSCPHPDRRIISFERRRAELLQDRQGRPAEPLLPSPFVRPDAGPVRTLDARRLEHRRRMLDHLNKQSAAS
jgi:hypothetical protein